MRSASHQRGVSRIILAVTLGVGLLIVVGVVAFLLFGNSDAPADNENTSGSTNTPPVRNVPTTETIPQPTNTNAATLPEGTPIGAEDQSRLEQISRSFAERFGSYSSEAAYENILDLKILMTPAMQKWADKTVADARANVNGSPDYYGITTTAYVVHVSSYDAEKGTATVTVGTQRRESRGSAVEPRSYQQDLTLTFAKVDGGWLIDQAVWQ